MLQLFGFDRVGVVLGDLYFLDPNPEKGQEGAERGVRLELRRLVAGELRGTIYAARPIEVDAPIWRVDLLETASGPVGSFDRTHHHPGFNGWDPSPRKFVRELSADPVAWVGEQLGDLESLLQRARVESATELGPRDAEDVRAALPEIRAALGRLLDGVREGRLAQPPRESVDAARLSWL